ncbi:RICIN domain-containing protein [Kitasatospora azatica]|uniref:RICIN domain-containing protein n=1 Tax=Kitasatospora azatica TaxID=58347 RepID=UPI00068F0C3B|nr:RICIN domain-containing protein [Kitasatospora azatica]
MSLRTRIAAAVLGAGLALTAAAPAANAAGADYFHPWLPDVVVLGNAAAPECLEIGGWHTENGAPANQWSCHYGANQQWSLVAGPSGSLVNVHSGKCLEIAGWRTDNGAPAQQWDCTGGWNQKWIWTHIPGTGYVLRNGWSGKCLEVALNPYAINGSLARQWDCWAGNNQIWYGLGPTR